MIVLNILLYVLIVCGIITVISVVVCIIIQFNRFRKGKNIEWGVLGRSFLTVLYLGAFVMLELDNYLSDVRKAGGFSEYKRKKKENEEAERLKREEKERITLAYKNGELKREELPRVLDGIKEFEFNRNIFNDDIKDFVYVENEYNEVLNDFFMRHGHIHFKHGTRVLYMPKLLNEIKHEDIVRYYLPYKHSDIQQYQTSSFSLFDDLAYPEDAQKMKHGIICIANTQVNHGVNVFIGHYFPIEEGTDESIMLQLENIINDWIAKNSFGLFYTDKSEQPEQGVSDDFADYEFWKTIYNDEIAILIEEVRERVACLQQYGVSRNLLLKMIEGKPKISRLVITRDYRIILPGYGNIEIKMEPLNKAVYLLFLRHEEGIIFKHLPDYEHELLEIYAKLKPMGINDKVRKSIGDICNPCLNSINEKCARIRGAFISQFDESLAKVYFITGFRGYPKGIKLPRKLVVWEE
ncbi:MAG: hypothetical protein J6C05_11595 [Prevotella sp.]|nr:hypothetical protein [Prevotella sp.]